MKNAIVIGGGLAGKLTAKALSHFFESILILEVDQENDKEAPRKKVPQTYHPHVLLKSGEWAIEHLFPQLFDRLIDRGSIQSNFTKDLKWHHFESWKEPFTGDLMLIQQSRPMLEWEIQKRLRNQHSISIHYDTKVDGLLLNQSTNRVSGVRARSLKTGKTNEYSADLVVDASGFSSTALKWLKHHHNIFVKEEKVWIQLFYSTQFFRLKEENSVQWNNLLISPSYPYNPYGGFIQRLEGDRFSVTFSGYNNESAPKTNEDFLAYAHKLPVLDVVEFLSMAQADSEIKIHKIPYQVRRRLDQSQNFPEGLIVVGDAHCRFDPLFGQGMSVAALEAVELKETLKRENPLQKGFSHHFHQKIAKLMDTPWDMATTEALRHPEIKGPRSLILKFKQWYTQKVYRASASDTEVYRRLANVMNLVSPTSHLFHPRVLLSLMVKKK